MNDKDTRNADYVYATLLELKKDPRFHNEMSEATLKKVIFEKKLTLTTRMFELLREMIRI